MDCNEILASKPSKNPKLPTSKRNQLSFLTLHRLPQTSNFSIQQLLTFQRHTTPSPKNHQLPSVLRGPCPRFGPRRSQPGQPIKISVNCIRPPSPEVDSPIWESRWKCLLDMQRRSNCWPYALSLFGLDFGVAPAAELPNCSSSGRGPSAGCRFVVTCTALHSRIWNRLTNQRRMTLKITVNLC